MTVEKSQNFENSLKLSKITLALSGIEIRVYNKNRDSGILYFMKRWIFFFNLIWLYPDVIGEFYWLIDGFMMGRPLNELFLSAPCAVICILATAKATFIYYNRHIVNNVIDNLRSIHPVEDVADSEKEYNFGTLKDFARESNTVDVEVDASGVNKIRSVKEFERRIVNETTKFLNLVVMFLYYLSAVVVIVFTTSPAFAMLYNYLNNENVTLRIPFQTKYFFDPFTPLRLPLVYAHQVWSTFIVVFNVFGADTLFYAFCSYLQMHFILLRHQLENVVSEKSIEETKNNIRNAIKRHQELIELVIQTELLYSKSVLCNFMSSTLLICLSAFIIKFVDDVGAVFSFVTFLVMSLAQIFLLCYFGDMLMTSSAQVFQAVYNCKWYTTNADIKKCILVVMMRAQRPCKLTAMGFADLNLTAFSAILSKSWSYFALLKTIMDN